ncbi:clustered-asparagine-rich protein [Cardiosporidium cionae]|uniref:Clustered-asparagine-rich protein n=1 Tax=Cardiosporidium cionae TaxID=476202 RepID=A0ABQ7JGM3_9APIC|nr:clustered-asparagine-rich protein [Cardiosporidium cionae]|eukprot:KAF8823049.1 clustered-asparagine-rich protein [Cardiosporidium cionae]
MSMAASTPPSAQPTDKGCKVFIGSIPQTVSEDELKLAVSRYGLLVSLFFMHEQMSQNRGWALATYQSVEEATLAIQSMDGVLKFPGSDQPVEARFADKKPEKVEQGGTYSPPAPRPPSIWIEYFTPEKHPYYYNTVTGVTQWERPLEMDNQTDGSPGTSGGNINAMTVAAGTTSSYGPRGSNLFIFHIPSDWNDIDLIQHFQHFGNIRSARIQRDSSGRNRGFGFVSFDNIQSARNAIRGMNGFSVGGKYLKVKVKKGEEDANDEGLDPSMGMYNGLPGAAAYQYNSLSPHPTQQAAMYATHSAGIRPHIPHFAPY